MTGDVDVEVSGAGGNTCHHTVQELRQADTHSTAHPTPRDALAQLVCYHGALPAPDATVFGRGHNLAFARLTLMILLRMAGMAILLGADRSTVWACLSDDHNG
jgi:hypothetical protein